MAAADTKLREEKKEQSKFLKSNSWQKPGLTGPYPH